MPWVTFTEDFDWDPPELKRRVTQVALAGQTIFVRQPRADAAIAAGKGRLTTNPNKSEPQAGEADGDDGG